MLAIDGKFDFAVKTNPFGGKPKAKPVDESVLQKRQAALDAINIKAKEVIDKKCQKQQKGS
jgi:hypothetical protein